MDRAAQHLAHRIADQTIQDSTCLLGVDQVHVDGTRLLDRLLDGASGDLLEGDAAHRPARLEAQRRHEMPGDGLALAIGVTRQQHRGGRASFGLERLDDASPGLRDDVFGGEVAIDVDPHTIGRQITNVAKAGAHHIAAAEIVLDGP